MDGVALAGFSQSSRLFHLLGTRPLYKSLAKRATRVTKTTLSGHPFTTYYFSV